MTTTAESTAERLSELHELLAQAIDSWALFQADVKALKQAMGTIPEMELGNDGLIWPHRDAAESSHRCNT